MIFGDIRERLEGGVRMRARIILASFCLTTAFSITGSAGQFPSVRIVEKELANYPAYARLHEYWVHPGDDPLIQLLKKRHNAALIAFGAYHSEFLAGRGTVGFMYDMAQKLRTSRLELCTAPTEILEVRHQYLDWARLIEAVQKQRRDAGLIAEKYYQESIFERLQAEIEVLRAESKSGKR
jgi:hypothetical protein